MEEFMDRLEAYLGGLRERGENLPTLSKRKQPSFRAISAASGIAYKHTKTMPFRQRIDLAVQEIGLGVARIQVRKGEKRRENLFNKKCALLNEYLKHLEARGVALPEDPDRRGEVFFHQVEIESGISLGSFFPRSSRYHDTHCIKLRKMITLAAARVGVATRILVREAATEPAPLTYQLLKEKGTAERRRELNAKSSARQQVYNTRSALNQFCKSVGVEMTAAVGEEFVTGFDGHVDNIIGRIESDSTRRKFQTEIRWWRDFHQRLINGRSLPNEFSPALTQLISISGLSHCMLARLAGVPQPAISRWSRGGISPEPISLPHIYRLESLFRLPVGTLAGKVIRRGKRFNRSQLPAFLRENRQLANRVAAHLPLDFCELPRDKQEEIVESIKSQILRSDDPYTENLRELIKLPYCLKIWPERLVREFNDLVAFKTGDRPPLGMQRNEKWRATTAVKAKSDLSAFYGAVLLPACGEDDRLLGLGASPEDLSLALLACPLLVDWYVRFRARRTQYTVYMFTLLDFIRALLRPGTGWLRQRPDLAFRLTPLRSGDVEVISPEFISRARADWPAVCDEARGYYKRLAKELEPLVSVARDPFYRIEGVLSADAPLSVFKIVAAGMKEDTPNQLTQPVRYHTAVRNRVLLALLAVTGFRITTLSQLDYIDGPESHLFLQDNTYTLKVPRALFKNEDGPFFGPKNSRSDYIMPLPNPYGLHELLSEYLKVSRPWLMRRYHQGCEEQPLFPMTCPSMSARMRPITIHDVYRRAFTKYLVENKWRGTGMSQVRPSGPHSARHIRATDTIKKTGSFQLAGDSIHCSERTARSSYARFLTTDRNERVNKILFAEE